MKPLMNVHSLIRISHIVRTFLLSTIQLYQRYLSPWLGTQCRFYPSCSQYAYEAINSHGCVNGCRLACMRLCKCHPWHPGGHDPVP